MNHTAIYNTHANVVSIDDTDGAFDADGNSVTLDETLIQAEITRLQTDYDSKQYARDRAKAYPSLEDQLDDIFHNGITGWKTSIQAVKDKYPKENNV